VPMPSAVRDRNLRKAAQEIVSNDLHRDFTTDFSQNTMCHSQEILEVGHELLPAACILCTQSNSAERTAPRLRRSYPEERGGEDRWWFWQYAPLSRGSAEGPHVRVLQ
jgi:hypothetical protein